MLSWIEILRIRRWNVYLRQHERDQIRGASDGVQTDGEVAIEALTMGLILHTGMVGAAVQETEVGVMIAETAKIDEDPTAKVTYGMMMMGHHGDPIDVIVVGEPTTVQEIQDAGAKG